MEQATLAQMNQAAGQASELLKALANEDRLMILCNLADGEKNVSELQAILQIRQPTLSQQLSRLRADRLVEARRSGRAVYYRLASVAAARVIGVLYELYCVPAAHGGGAHAAGDGEPVAEGLAGTA